LQNELQKIRKTEQFRAVWLGLPTRIADLLTFGIKPFWAFSIGVAVNVPVGYFLSTVVFPSFWSNISSLK
jgi:hypothetical protein